MSNIVVRHRPAPAPAAMLAAAEGVLLAQIQPEITRVWSAHSEPKRHSWITAITTTALLAKAMNDAAAFRRSAEVSLQELNNWASRMVAIQHWRRIFGSEDLSCHGTPITEVRSRISWLLEQLGAQP